MIYVEAPERYPPESQLPKLFLAGGITGVQDWQSEAATMLRPFEVMVFNPRRAAFDVRDEAAGDEQIEWEHEHLRAADVISFWFSFETLHPITLYELGAWSMTDKPIIVGAHPDFPRRIDVVKQTKLARPEVKVYASLEETIRAAASRANAIQIDKERRQALMRRSRGATL
jgi:Nucleoside 2-deoxyribosyltransferase like